MPAAHFSDLADSQIV